ncbi:MAG: sigma 54-interacting transcriptional regulator, partial [Myxococcota bacterium]|nr:sigma 54-interacting transcriptional regulator [Myxococcota bacterium]
CVDGAFTGARQRTGLIGSAHQGTLFLDEVGELSLEIQAALLRVLEYGEVTPVGGIQARRVDFRLITATHQPLESLVERRRFRADLYHRISTLPLWVPPLREREGDLPILINELVPSIAPRLSRGAWQRLQGYHWPGNIRELKNILLRAAAEYPEGWIDAEALTLGGRVVIKGVHQWGGRPLRQQSDLYILDAVRAHGGNLRASARALEVSVNTIYRALSRLRERFDGTTDPAELSTAGS